MSVEQPQIHVLEGVFHRVEYTAADGQAVYARFTPPAYFSELELESAAAEGCDSVTELAVSTPISGNDGGTLFFISRLPTEEERAESPSHQAGEYDEAADLAWARSLVEAKVVDALKYLLGRADAAGTSQGFKDFVRRNAVY